jgi:two-component system response regulator FixJ
MPPTPTVYIVNDNRTDSQSLEVVLQSAGFSSASYQDPQTFLKNAPHLSDGCVLLDAVIMNGVELLTRLLATGFPHPVVVMADQDDVTAAVEAMKAGAVDILEKPFDDKTLVYTVETHACTVSSGYRHLI